MLKELPYFSKVKSLLYKQRETLIAIGSISVGLSLGLVLKFTRSWNEEEIAWISLLGNIFMRSLQCLSIPLVLPKLITAIGSMDVGTSGKALVKLISSYFLLNIILQLSGVAIYILVDPASHVHTEPTNQTSFLIQDSNFDSLTENNSFNTNHENITNPQVPVSWAVLDLFFNMFPDNIFTTPFTRYQTIASPHGFAGQQTNAPNILGMVVAATAVGVAISQSRKTEQAAESLLHLFHDLSMVTSTLMEFLMTWLCPVGLASLLAGQVVALENPLEVARQMGMFILVMFLGDMVLPLILLPLILFFLARTNPITFFTHMLEAIMVILGTSSSVATYPVTLRCLVQKVGLDSQLSGLLLSLAILINLCSYPIIAVLYIAQLENMDLDVGQIVVTIIMLTLLTFGTSGIPQDSFLTILLVLSMHGIPTTHMARLLAMDWLLDRIDSFCKVLTDSTLVTLVASSQKTSSKLHLNVVNI